MFFYIINVLLLLLYERSAKIGALLLTLIFCACTAVSAYLALSREYRYPYPSLLVPFPYRYFSQYFVKPYARAPAYCLGISTGLLYRSFQKREYIGTVLKRLARK